MKFKLSAGTLWFLLYTFFALQNVNAQDKKPFIVAPEHVLAGESVLIKYDPATTSLKGMDQIKGVIYLFRNFKWIADDLEMLKKDGHWECAYPIPEDAALLTCKFSSGDLVDNGGQVTYSWFIGKKDPSKGPVPGSYIGWGLLRNKVIREEKPSFLSPESYIGNDVVVYWFNQELRYSPVSRRPMFSMVMEFLQATDTLRAQKAATRESADLLSQQDLTEKELLSVMKVYREVLKRKVSADSLEEVILRQFPKGSLACDKQIIAIQAEQDAATRLAMWEKCKATFSASQMKYGRSEVMKRIYPTLLKNIVETRLVEADQVAGLESDFEVAPYSLLADLQTLLLKEGRSVGKKKKKHLSFLAEQLKMEVNKASVDRMIPESQLFSPSEWKERILKDDMLLNRAVVSAPKKEN